MANIHWRGGAPATAEVRRFAVAGSWATTETVTIKIGQKTIVITLGPTSAGSTTTVAAAIVAAFNGAAVSADETRTILGTAIPAFDEITAANVGANLTFTGDTLGRSFAISFTETAASGSITTGTVTAATGPNHFNDAANYYAGVVPTTGDTLFMTGAIDMTEGLDQNAITLAALHIPASYTGKIGLQLFRNRDAATEYAEYRQTALKIGASAVHIGKGDGNGSQLIRLDLVGGSSVYIHSTGSPEFTDDKAVWITGGTNMIVIVSSGSVGFGCEPGDAISINTLTMDGTDDEDLPIVAVGNNGSGTCTNLNIKQGTVVVDAGTVTTTTQYAGECLWLAPSGGTLLKMEGGTMRPVSSVTWTTITLYGSAHLDGTDATLSWTTMTVYAGAKFTYPGTIPAEITLAAGVWIAGTTDKISVATLNLGILTTQKIGFTAIP